MLAELEIENLAVIAHARIPFSPHLNVFTGETGAGKSILLHGIHAVLGQRVTRDIVRTGCKKAVVTALFTHLDPLVCARLDALSISHTDDELLLTREIAADGGSAARVNGHTTTVSVLREIGDALINIHGQHDNQVLLAPECHLQILDAFGGDDTLLHQYQDTFRQLQQTAKRLNHLAKQEQDKAHRRQQLKALVAEVDELGLEQGEEEALEEELNLLQHAESIAAALQDGAYADEKYQSWRNILTETCRAEVGALNPELVSVRLHRKAVEHYQKPEAFTALSETDKGTLMREVAPLISLDDKDEAAKRFDNFVYGLVLCELEGLPGLTRAQRQLKNTAALLEQKATIPQVQAKLPLIREVQTDEFLTSHDLLRFEEMRQELRELIKFLVEGGEGQKPIYTALADPVLEQTEGKALDSGYDFGEYRERVNRYIMEHRSDTLAIHKLTQNIPLSQGDYTELEHIFTSELGSKEDYAREFKDTPFGLLVRKVAKLDHEAAMQAFSKFINDESLNAKQIAFVQKVIHYIEQNGYVESKAVLMKPPFDQPILFTRLFDGKMGGELMETINSVKENATHVTA